MPLHSKLLTETMPSSGCPQKWAKGWFEQKQVQEHAHWSNYNPKEVMLAYQSDCNRLEVGSMQGMNVSAWVNGTWKCFEL